MPKTGIAGRFSSYRAFAVIAVALAATGALVTGKFWLDKSGAPDRLAELPAAADQGRLLRMEHRLDAQSGEVSELNARLESSAARLAELNGAIARLDERGPLPSSMARPEISLPRSLEELVAQKPSPGGAGGLSDEVRKSRRAEALSSATGLPEREIREALGY